MMTFHLGSSMDLKMVLKMETMMMHLGLMTTVDMIIISIILEEHYGLTANGLSGQRMDLALNHVDMEFKNTNE